jgi:DNA-binding HxlR family transcriptional regulator
MALKDIELTCAIAKSTYLLGDSWSLLILRDMLLHHKTRFKEFLNSKEKISTNILTNRIKNLTDNGLIKLLDPDSTKKNRQYIATKKGISTLTTIIELYLFSIMDIDELILNEDQLKIKKNILSNRKAFQNSKLKNYLAFIEKLLDEVNQS